jgi:hypothetical protein
VIFWTDYDTVQLRYACGTIKLSPTETQPYAYYFVLVRSRAFNDIGYLNYLIDELLMEKTKTRDISFMFNQPSCIN